MPPPPFTVIDFVSDDNPRGLFPLDNTTLYIGHGSSSIQSYITNEILNPTHREASFISAPVCYALKDARHLRKVLALDPISTYFLYDFVLRHSRSRFQVTKPDHRRRYGYAFKGRRPLSPSEQYHEFRRATYVLKKEYSFFAKVDLTNCFNSFYHHDVSRFVADLTSADDGDNFSQFLREINGGISINCFPQGIYPAKTIGNSFLSFIEQSAELRSPAIIRFLDDVFLFANRESDLNGDLLTLQEIIGVYNLSLNSAKTRIGSRRTHFDERRIDIIKKKLLRKREEAFDYEGEYDPSVDLESEERDYLHQILKARRVEEEDLELALSLIDEDSVIVRLVELVCQQHPHLLKYVYRLFSAHSLDDDGACWELFKQRVHSDDVSEYELFWIAKIVLKYYEVGREVVDLLSRIERHRNSTAVVAAAILETASNDYGLLEMKEKQLRSSPGNMLGTAALMGLRALNKAKRNHLCTYVSKAGLHMKLYSDIVRAL